MNSERQYLLVEPIAKTPYPPLGLMKIGTMLRRQNNDCRLFDVIGCKVPTGVRQPREIYITTLFTWDLDCVVKTANFYRDKFPGSQIRIGGIAATLLPDHIENATGIRPHLGLLTAAEKCPPDYSLTFGRQATASLTFTSRGCPSKCHFCNVKTLEPKFFVRNWWKGDIDLNRPDIVLWDNNFLASPNLTKDCATLKKLGKRLDFNQGLDARRYTESTAKLLSGMRINPIRFAFDDLSREDSVLRAIKLAKKYAGPDIRVYVLFNYNDTPEDLYYRLNILNKTGVLAFPMEYRRPCSSMTRFPGQHWNTALLRAFRLSVHFYYRQGMITKSRRSFLSIYGKTPKQFISKLYDIYQYDKTLKRK